MVHSVHCRRLRLALAAACLALGLPARASEPTLPRGEWEQHGFTAAQREQIRAGFQRAIDAKLVPGASLLLIHQGEVILREGYGVADFETQQPFSPDAPCRIASVTKPHSATVLTMLAAQGTLSLEEPVSLWLPEFAQIKVRGKGPARHVPTLAECLSHTAGFPGNAALKNGGEDEIDLIGTLADVVSDLAKEELVAEPGTTYAYSRLGYMVAGRVAEVVTGKEFAVVMDEMLLEPLGATQATFFPSDEMEAAVPTFYERDSGGIHVREGERPAGKVVNPGGGLYSTLDDVGRLLLLHRNRGKVNDKELVPAEWLAKMYVAQPGTNGNGYGLGFNILTRRPDGTASRIQHIGASGTLVMLDFDQDLALVVFTQVGGGRNQWRDQHVRTILRLLAD